MDRRDFLTAAAPLGLVAVTGCSSSETPTETDGGETDTATPGGTETPTPNGTDTPTAGDTETPTDSGTPTDSSTPASEADLTVSVAPGGSLRFDPETFTVSAGDTVRWEWDSAGHNVSPASQPDDADWPGKDETTYDSGTTYTYTFDVAGAYEYHCDPHRSSGMTGSFTVE